MMLDASPLLTNFQSFSFLGLEKKKSGGLLTLLQFPPSLLILACQISEFIFWLKLF